MVSELHPMKILAIDILLPVITPRELLSKGFEYEENQVRIR
jgi:hypothetical protein